MTWIVPIATLVGIAPVIYVLLGRRMSSRWGERGALMLITAVLALMPFELDDDRWFWRMVLASIAVSFSVKAVEFSRERLSDPSIRRSFGRFLLWLWVPHDTAWPTRHESIAEARKLGRERALRALAKTALFLGLIALESPIHFARSNYAISVVYTAVQFYLFMTLIADALAAALSLVGLKVQEIFQAPFLARSPADFWSRRWNLYIGRFAARHIFQPLGGHRHKLLATAVVFFASALMHEYLVWAIFGVEARFGFMSAFFALQALAVIGHDLWVKLTWRRGRLPRPVAVALHAIWFFPTTPLFFEPLGPLLELFGIDWQPIPNIGLLFGG